MAIAAADLHDAACPAAALPSGAPATAEPNGDAQPAAAPTAAPAPAGGAGVYLTEAGATLRQRGEALVLEPAPPRTKAGTAEEARTPAPAAPAAAPPPGTPARIIPIAADAAPGAATAPAAAPATPADFAAAAAAAAVPAPVRTLPAQGIESITLIGPVHVSREALQLCIDRGITLAWLTAAGRLRARVVPEADPAAPLHLAQARLLFEAPARRALAARIVAAKLTSQLSILLALARNHGLDPLRPAIGQLRQALALLPGAADEAQLLGLEGAGARAYFAGLAVSGFRRAITFSRRQRQPPPDPANALLSFGYALLTTRLEGLLAARGFLVGFGVLHTPHSGRPSLALDLLEEFRAPLVDRLVMRLCNLGQFVPADFTPDPLHPGGVQLTRPALKKFVAEWHALLERTLRDPQAGDTPRVRELLERQVERLAQALRTPTPYTPYVWQ